jgi:hypothetical protein
MFFLKALPILVSIVLFSSQSQAALSLSESAEICDSFYEQDMPPAQEGGHFDSVEELLTYQYVKCALIYVQTGQVEKVEFAKRQNQRMLENYYYWESSFSTLEQNILVEEPAQ